MAAIGLEFWVHNVKTLAELKEAADKETKRFFEKKNVADIPQVSMSYDIETADLQADSLAQPILYSARVTVTARTS